MSELKRVTGIGGIFFRSKDPKATRDWYGRHLGLNIDEQYGTSFEWRYADAPEKKGSTIWSPFKENTEYFGPNNKAFMINYRVENLEKLLEVLRAEGVEVVGDMQAIEY